VQIGVGEVQRGSAASLLVAAGHRRGTVAGACTPAPVPVEFPDGPADAVTPVAPDLVGPIQFRGQDLVGRLGKWC
jgi:hypothetical protein